MEQFVVPQYIDIEDKIIGPITTRQFIIILFTLFIDFIFFKLLTFIFFIIVFVLFTGFAIVLAFTKINGQPFHYFLLNVLQTLRRPSIRVWQPYVSSADLKVFSKTAPPPPPKVEVKKKDIGTSRLAELALLVNTGGVYKPEE